MRCALEKVKQRRIENVGGRKGCRERTGVAVPARMKYAAIQSAPRRGKSMYKDCKVETCWVWKGKMLEGAGLGCCEQQAGCQK